MRDLAVVVHGLAIAIDSNYGVWQKQLLPIWRSNGLAVIHGNSKRKLIPPESIVTIIPSGLMKFLLPQKIDSKWLKHAYLLFQAPQIMFWKKINSMRLKYANMQNKNWFHVTQICKSIIPSVSKTNLLFQVSQRQNYYSKCLKDKFIIRSVSKTNFKKKKNLFISSD